MKGEIGVQRLRRHWRFWGWIWRLGLEKLEIWEWDEKFGS